MHTLKMALLFSFVFSSAFAFTPEELKQVAAQAKEDLQKFTALPCESEAAKTLYEQIKIPVLKFKDGKEQIMWPLKTADGSKIDIAVTGTPKQGGLFSPTSIDVGVVQRKVSFTKVKSKTYYKNPADGPKSARQEVASQREISLSEASASIYQRIDICKAQSLLKAVSGSL